MTPAIDTGRVTRELEALAALSDAPAPAVTRVVFTETDLRARAFVIGLCREAGLSVRTDAVGNTFARWSGSEPTLAPVATGSHIDAIPNAGRFDGTVGVLGGLEAIRALQRAGFTPRRPIELIVFTAEEPTRFGIGCLGSRLLAGALDAERAGALLDRDGTTLDVVRREAGFDGSLADVRLGSDEVAAFVELHIEQGPLLERDGLDIGVVTAIAAPASLAVRFTGEGGHAGAVLMPDRRDALVAAAEAILMVEQTAKATGAIDTVATTGVCQVFPGAVNSVPSIVDLDIDVRDTETARRDGVVDTILSACQTLGAARRVATSARIVNADPPARCDESIVSIVGASADRLGLRSRPMISRAYHDSLFMARIAPTAMIFIPCRGGISHRPDEYSAPEAIDRGTAVLAATIATLAG